MSYQQPDPTSPMPTSAAAEPLIPVSPTKLQETFVTAMSRVYLWMFLGLSITTIVSFGILFFPDLLNFIYSNPLVVLGLFIVQIILVMTVSAAVMRLSTGIALLLFFAYAALNGVTLSFIFLMYTASSLAITFGISAGLFLLMSIIGFTTKQDLTRWGPILFVGLLAFLGGTIVNIFLASTTLMWLLTYAGIAIFLGLIMYDTQRIKEMTYQLLANGETSVVSRIGVLGALRLYLDFINLFLLLLRIFGRRR